MIIIPTTGLKNNFTEVEKRIAAVKDSSRWIQVDVCDGIFLPGKTFELELLNKLSFPTEDILWDVHLMVKEPINWVEKCISVGASRIIGQREMMSDMDKFREEVKAAGLEVGLAIDTETEVGKIEGDWDIVLLMGRKAGWEQYPLSENIFEKIKRVKEMGYMVGIDGAVNEENISKLEEAGVDVIYSESEYFKLKNDN